MKIEAQDTKFPVCQTAIGSVTRQSRISHAFLIKTTSDCGKLKVMHYTCAIKFSKITDNTYKVKK